MDTKRLILFVIFSFSILMLWDSWQRDQQPPAASQTQTTAQSVEDGSVPQAAKSSASAANQASVPAETGFRLQSAERINVETDLYKASIDTIGGDLRRLELREHKDDEDQTKNFVLMDDQSAPMLYVAQTGLIGNGLPTHKEVFTSESTNYQLAPGEDKLDVRLTWKGDNGVEVHKIYTFRRDSYAIEVSYEIRNNSDTAVDPSVYYQIVHDNQSHQGSYMMPTFTGGAYYTEADKYKKLSFSDMAKTNLSKNASDGWVGLVQHYFVSAWIPEDGLVREFYTKKLSDNVYSIGSVSPLGNIAPGQSVTLKSRLYAGPQTQSELKSVAPGLEYTVDYGWLTVIATPLFWILSSIQKVVHNWGVAIILLTILIKLVFYPLSAASYRSMANMRELAPRLQRLKEQYGDDRQKLHQAMMEMYKTEKINPMGGCLPILVQIPVFIALYWVLLGSVEMRHAPFMLWIQDLSAVDPYYVLPILMGITMIIQTKLNPKPADPIQAKVMTIMPIVFSVFFFFFPAGLVLYWLVNNILSIAQQWYINRSTERAAAKKKGNARR
ncbi:membrane protein insertase YidC [Methylobacillus flagellatus]|uniref:Membrane protein insertase YidC n=1 Tax=Methylobacillus flagellatus (strain ATCC 51484 / DSM 6875 / VKM B-1610 / KT) TaxID=265072 RepID=YIDC_METFK|nr:membrane protein insertase YidC [Methylobacillus flagellatus]Q1GXL6.1 RecName: Full=Membrane protein insertase YidC; AltName: Full=Foldase YidC; AltName: Full=Membrane integrase YidC; AltName: Full=Membrane protein YidC [Methylobacillus flagellatus KT]ABE51021.1 protein translocase subunit yidC [Methylobacillus flagellatus KT]